MELSKERSVHKPGYKEAAYSSTLLAKPPSLYDEEFERMKEGGRRE